MELTVNSSKKYKIKIERGLISKRVLPKGFIITDKNLAKFYPRIIEKDNAIIVSPGEKSKSLITYEKILKKLNNPEKIIAFGGGVVGDLAGFVASTYKRGTKLIQIPTSLLAMVDSSIGGKTGVNLGNIKNQVGTIYQPEEVLIDPLFLETLPKEEFENGLAEVIKYSFLFGTPSLERLEKRVSLEDEDLEEIIFQCCKNKASIIEQDEFDSGIRHILNFGHTIGHAIELLCNLKHGQAVSIGMIKELEIFQKKGIVNEKDISLLKSALKSNNLPVELPEKISIDSLLEVMKSDKKGRFIFSLNKENPKIELEESELKEYLRERYKCQIKI